jgi:ELWxxDGT repeat protein
VPPRSQILACNEPRALARDLLTARLARRVGRLSTLFFTAVNGGMGYQLWSTDGTPKGTKVLTTFANGNSTNANNLTPFGSALLFAQPSTQLWTYLPAAAAVSTAP